MIKNPENKQSFDFEIYTIHIETDEMPVERLIFYKNKIEQAFLEEQGPKFPADYIRKVFRKPDLKGLRYLEGVCFA